MTTTKPESGASEDFSGQDWGSWPTYEAATLGFRNYWYPVAWAHQISEKPTPITVCGEQVMLVRDGKEIRAMHDRCPHRGVPLSLGRRQFEGTISCPYHGWTWDLENGDLRGVLTDGPESPICGRLKVRTYPIEQRLGLVWVYIGDTQDGYPPVERDIPAELLENDLVIGGRSDVRPGNWRFAAENGFDEGTRKVPPQHRTVALVQGDAGVERYHAGGARGLAYPGAGRGALGGRHARARPLDE
jgi:phenylpropionate dioxygenase-like ring-hydroxylating dioxygenase large terminal subunit